MIMHGGGSRVWAAAGVASASYPNQPGDFTAIVGRNFNTKAADNNDRGTGLLPWKTTGSEGWDGSEYNQSLATIVADITDPVAGGGGAKGSVARVTYDGITSNNSPAVVQTLSFSGGNYDLDDPTRLYVLMTLRLGSTYQVGGVTNKMFFHGIGAAANCHYVRLANNGDANGPFTLQVNFQGTPDNAANDRGGTNGTWTASGGSSQGVQRGVFYTIETLSIRNSGVGVQDGIFRLWLDGVLVLERLDVEFVSDMSKYFSYLHISPTCGSCSDLTQPFSFDLGMIYVSGRA